ncbi:MAG: hypothetical protein WA919_04835 [Coleofasciculaceae cyanobacterium]
MVLIRDIVEQAMTKGYLTIEAEMELRQLLQKTKYGGEDFCAFMRLQAAVIDGQVKQESREVRPVALQ